ncbi:MAG: aminotransferase class V-fold PLP-dependent enzyme [Candidatus Planktophila sp.]
MAHLTGNFTSEAPLSPAVREAISAAFEQGWADPKKASQSAGKASILTQSAKGEIAKVLGTSPEKLEVVGEPALVHFLALQGFSRGELPLYLSSADVGKIRAIARQNDVEGRLIGIDANGILVEPGFTFPRHSVISLQASNGETGATQDLDHWRNHYSYVVLDATRAIPTEKLVGGFAATTLDAQSWNGPAGIGLLHIEDSKNFSYPLPHIAPIRVPGTYSLPLLIGAAVAIKEFVSNAQSLTSMRAYFIDLLEEIPGVTVLAKHSGIHSRHISIIVDDISAEEVLRTLLQRSIAIDAGSACSPEDLAPSHVIAAMGYPTTGHLRMTLHPGHTHTDVDKAVHTMKEVLSELRR